MTRQRLRDLGLTIGITPTGPANTISDVAGVSVGHATINRDEPRVARTGVTVINPRLADRRDHLCYGGMYSFNGNGEMTGSHWLEESGLLSGPIGITNTHQVGIVRDTLVAAEVERDPMQRGVCRSSARPTTDSSTTSTHSTSRPLMSERRSPPLTRLAHAVTVPLPRATWAVAPA